MRPVQEGNSSFNTGDEVEYFSGSQGKWIPAKVLLQRRDGRLDLDCKQDVLATQVRWPSSHGFAIGDVVEYYSSSQAAWISARVTSLKAKGRMDLDCKLDVSLDSVRPALKTSERLPTLLDAGESVEYFGAKMQRWIPAKVLKRNSNGTYDLDCKPGVMPEKVRKVKSQLSSRASSPASTGMLAPYKEGDRVEYFSGSQCRWIPARVLGVLSTGNFNLDCKSEVPTSKIRLPSKPPADYEEGEVVDYFGASKGLWISTKVLKINEDGTYDLACKPRVLPENMRKTSQKEAAVDVKGPVFNLGDAVEYFGVSQGRWVPAKVLSMTAAGNYNLDVKQDVPVERLRAGRERSSDRPAPGDPGSPSHTRAAAASMQPGATLSSVSAFTEPMQLLRYTRRSGFGAAGPCQSVGQRSTATGQRPDQRQRAGDEGRLPEHLWLEDERRKLLVDVQAKQSAHAALEADVKRLHKELEQQRAETNEQTRLLRERLEHERRQGAHLELQILKAQIGASDKSEEAQEVKHEVETKTKEILKVVQVLSDQHRSAFQQVATLSSDILRACSSRSPVVNNDLLTSRTAGIEFAGSAGASAASARVNGGVEKEQMEQGPDRDLPWFQAMKANLEEL
eukprot:symbB.v1.2.009331.t1/scaffold588.1/size186386/8